MAIHGFQSCISSIRANLTYNYHESVAIWRPRTAAKATGTIYSLRLIFMSSVFVAYRHWRGNYDVLFISWNAGNGRSTGTTYTIASTDEVSVKCVHSVWSDGVMRMSQRACWRVTGGREGGRMGGVVNIILNITPPISNENSLRKIICLQVRLAF